MSRSKRRTRSLHPSGPPAPALTPAAMALLVALAATPSLFNIQSGASFEPDKAAVIVLLAVIALVDFIGRGWRGAALRVSSLRRNPWALLVAGLGLWAGVITQLSIDATTSLWGNYYRGYGLLTLLAGLVFVGVAWEMTGNGRQWLLVDAALLGAAIPIFYGFVQMLDMDPVRGFGISFPLGERASSSLGNPLYLGDYLLIVLLLGVARGIHHPPKTALARRTLEVFLAAAFLLLALTFSRSAHLGLTAATVVMMVLLARGFHDWGQGSHGQRREIRSFSERQRMLGGALAGLTGGALAMLMLALWPRLQHGGTLQQRLLIWQAALQLFQARPRALLVGLGFDTLPLAIAPYLPSTLGHFEPDFVFRIPDRAHNLLLDMLLTGGLPWLLGWLALGWLALRRLLRTRTPLAAWLAAMIIGRGALLLVSFPTHAPDMLFWAGLGLALGLRDGDSHPPGRSMTPASPTKNEAGVYPLLAMAAWGVFGFSLSAAWPGGLLLWLLAALPLAALLLALAAGDVQPLDPLPLLILTVFIMPAILLNQRIGRWAQVAWMWLLLWLTALALIRPRPTIKRLPGLILRFGVVALLLWPIARPRLGDIAYKSALLARAPTSSDFYLTQAVKWTPHKHVIWMGMAWSLSQRLQPDADAYPEGAFRIVRLYLGAMEAQPLAPEPPANLARWLTHLSASDSSYAVQAQDAFDRALALSPHDIQTLNDQARLWALTGRSDAAIAEFRRLLTLDPLYGPTYRNLAQVYRQVGDEDAARLILQQGRERVPWWDAWEDEGP